MAENRDASVRRIRWGINLLVAFQAVIAFLAIAGVLNIGEF